MIQNHTEISKQPISRILLDIASGIDYIHSKQIQYINLTSRHVFVQFLSFLANLKARFK